MTFKKYSSIVRYGKKGTEAALEGSPHIVIWEKIDGANSSIELLEGKLKCYSRNKELDEGNTLQGFYNWVHEHFTEEKQEKMSEGLVLYGEWAVKHKLDYGENANKFYLFDVYDKEKEEYLHIDKVKEFAELHSLLLAPIFYEGEFQSIEHIQSFVGKSALGEIGEGVVCKSYDYRDRFGNQLFTKFVSDEFAEMQKVKKHKVKSKTDPLLTFVQSTLTEARVSKLLHKLVDEGELNKDYSIENMRDILKGLNSTVYEDIMKEESDELFNLVKRQVGKSLPNIVKEVLKNDGRM